MAAVANVAVKVDARDASQKLRDFAAQAKKTDTAVKGMNGGLSKAKGGLVSTGAAAKTASAGVRGLGAAFSAALAPIAAITAAVGFFTKAIGVSSDREADVRALADSLGQMGKTTKDLRLLQEQADKFGNATLFNQEDFTKASKNLTSFTDIALKDYDRIIKASADIATKTGGNVQEASLQLAKALNAPSQNLSALSRSGIQFSEAQKAVIKRLEETGKKAEAQNLILAELEKQYGGAAEAAAGGFAGSLDTLGEQFRDFQEGVGKIAQGVLKPFVDGLAAIFGAVKKVQPAFQLFLEGIGKIVSAFAPIGEALFGNADIWGMWGDVLVNAYKIAAVVASDVAVVVRAMAEKLASILKRVMTFVSDTFTSISNGLTSFFGGAAESSATGMKAIVQNVANGIRKIRDLIATLINLTGPGFVSEKLGFDAGRFMTGGLGALAGGIEGGFDYLSGLQARADALELPSFEVGAGTGVGGVFGGADSKGGKGRKGRTAGRSKKNKEQEEHNRLMREALGIALKQTGAFTEQLRSLDDQKAILEAKLVGNEREVRLALKIRDATRDLAPEFANAIEQKLRGVDALEKQVEAAEKLKKKTDLLADVWSGVGNEVKGIFDALISGTQDWNAVLTDTLRSFSQLLLNAGFSAIGQSAGKDSLLGKLFGGFRANGGPVSPGKSYMVGERGPEMFVPSGKGSIVANRDLGGGTVINITNNIAEGGAQTNARGEGQSAAAMNQLSKMMVAVIQREQRPGGVLSRR